MADLLDSSTNVVMGLLVAVILICSALIPVALNQIENLKAMFVNDAEALKEINSYTTMLEVVIILAIVGLIIGVVRTYTRTNEVD